VEQAISFFGSPSEAESLCNGQWLIFPKTVICPTDVGERPKRSYFENGGHFCWVADQPYHVSDERWSPFVPAQVVGSQGKERAIHLFVRAPEARDYLYLGELEPSYMQASAGAGEPRHGSLRAPTCPSQSGLACARRASSRQSRFYFGRPGA